MCELEVYHNMQVRKVLDVTVIYQCFVPHTVIAPKFDFCSKLRHGYTET